MAYVVDASHVWICFANSQGTHTFDGGAAVRSASPTSASPLGADGKMNGPTPNCPTAQQGSIPLGDATSFPEAADPSVRADTCPFLSARRQPQAIDRETGKGR